MYVRTRIHKQRDVVLVLLRIAGGIVRYTGMYSEEQNCELKKDLAQEVWICV
jgi:hypothetical protein